MGIIHPKQFRDKQIKRIVDRVYDYFTGHSGRDYLTSQELYTAVLLVYNDINKHIPGPHYDPPTKEEVEELLKEFDTNNNDMLDRGEFTAFIRRFSSNVVHEVQKNLLIFAVAAPTLAFATKRATEDVPHVGKIVKKIPNGVYASLVTAFIILIQKTSSSKA